MASEALNPLLLDAKREYLNRLIEVISPFIISFLDCTYKQAVDEEGGRALMAFQNALRTVPAWNSAIIRDHTQRIEAKYTFLGDLVAATFVSFVKVLSSIRLSSQRPNVKLKLPSNENFIHRVYEICAKNFYENPYAIRDRGQKTKLVANSIEMAVRDMLPLKDILQAYLSTAVDQQEQTFNPVLSPNHSRSSSDSEDEQEDGDGDRDDESHESDDTKVISLSNQPQEAPVMTEPFPDFPADPVQPNPPPQLQQQHSPLYIPPQPVQPMTQQAPPLTPPQQQPQQPQPVHPLPQQHPAAQATVSTLFDDAEDDERHF